VTIATWDNSFRTGDRFVDTQHQELFRMVNDLHDAIVMGMGKHALTATLENLINYTVEHFEEEECLMNEMHYPGLPRHHLRHKGLTDRVIALAGEFSAGRAVLPITLSQFLTDWLLHHIKEDDVAFIKYVQTQNGAHEDATGAVTAAQ